MNNEISFILDTQIDGITREQIIELINTKFDEVPEEYRDNAKINLGCGYDARTGELICATIEF